MSEISNEEVFIETDIEIGSVVGFSQYILNNGKLISLFAEIHDRQFKCKNEYVSISEYVINILKNKKKVRLLLEYNKDTDKIISIIGSYNIQDIIKLLKENDINIDDTIISIDNLDKFFNDYKKYIKKEENLDIISKLKDYVKEQNKDSLNIKIKKFNECLNKFKTITDSKYHGEIDNIEICLIESKLNKIVEPIDYRDYFFNSYQLYADDKIFMNMTIEQIVDQFLFSYYIKKHELLKNGEYIYIDKRILNNEISEKVKNKYIHYLLNNIEIDDEIINEVVNNLPEENKNIFKENLEKYKINNEEYVDILINYNNNDIVLTDEIKTYFIKQYIPEIEKDFKDIYDEILKNKKSVKKNKKSVKKDTIDMFKTVWMKVADFFVLREIFNDKREKFSGELIDKELIILIGNMHYYNIERIMKNFKITTVTSQFNDEDDKNSQNCVKSVIFEKIKLSELEDKISKLEKEKEELIEKIIKFKMPRIKKKLDNINSTLKILKNI